MIHVALDLGSESMAAFYNDSSTGKSGMIKLQAYAEKLLDDIYITGSEIDYLKEKPNNGGEPKVSPRLWNRVSLRHGAQPKELPIDHAKLRFIGPDKEVYKKSLFRYFHAGGEWPPRLEALMPNPKILFQHQIREILPIVKAVNDEVINLTPEILVKHLSLQVIINFVLNSPELRNADRKDIHLTVTIPNVYSLPHAESLKDFLREHVDVAEVEILSESDAVAYFVLAAPDKDDPKKLADFKVELDRSLTKRRKLCLITLDIGKGTTDLSCILVEDPKTDRAARRHGFLSKFFKQKPRTGDAAAPDLRLRHSVQGKTGKCSGGNHLNFLFASYYDQCLHEAVPLIKESTGLDVPFGFIIRTENPIWQEAQVIANSVLEKLIEEVKQSISENYVTGLTPAAQRDLIDNVAKRMLDAINPAWEQDGTIKSEDFRQQLISALTLPAQLKDETWHPFLSIIRPLLAPARKRASVTKDNLAPSKLQIKELLESLQGYVKENVDDLLESLRSLVQEHQAVVREGETIDRNTFIVISGQASQFKPIRAAIREKCKELQIKRTQQYLMEGVVCKEACCKGVISYRKANLRHLNPRELHGTYGCLPSVLFEKYKPFDMTKIKNGGTTAIQFSSPMEYYVVFTPRPYKEVSTRPPIKNDGATAFIKTFTGQSQFIIEYDRDNLELKVNGEKLDFVGFGNVNSEIYPKVWPEILKKPEEQ